MSLRGIQTYVKEETKCFQGVFVASKSDVALLLYQARICKEYCKDFRSSAVVIFNNQKRTCFAPFDVVTDSWIRGFVDIITRPRVDQ